MSDGGSSAADAAGVEAPLSASPSPTDVARAALGRRAPAAVRARKASFGDEIPDRPLYKVVLTGGPCAGKTTSMARITDFLRSRGFRVYVVPEAATMLWKGGATPDDLAAAENRILFQRQLIGLQMKLEDSFVDLAQLAPEPVVIMCDRGTMDGKAYMDASEWDTMLGVIGMSEVELRETRYNAILHLVTAADGAESHYSKASNETRYEPPETARAVDVRLRRAWVGHPKQFVIDNKVDFAEKQEMVIDVMAHLVGLPSTLRRCRKYVLELKPDVASLVAGLPKQCQTVKEFRIEKTFLATAKAPGGEKLGTHFVRRRWSPDAPNLVVYGLTSQIPTGEGSEVEETKQIITESLFNHLTKNHTDRKRRVVTQTRWCCMWEDADKETQHYFEIHVYDDVKPPLALLYVQLSDSKSEPTVPPFLPIKEEVTDRPEFSANHLALR